MQQKTVPFTREQIEKLSREHPTPFYVYDEEPIIDNARRLVHSFQGVYGFKNYFAVKALPNKHILKILQKEGMGADCSSGPELTLSKMAGITGEEVMFTSNNTPEEEFRRARELGAIINLDDISHIPFLEQSAGIPEVICFRYNPGKLREGNVFIGKPEEAKYGLTKPQLFEAYKIMKEKGVKRFGLHTMVASNELDPQFFVETANMLYDLVVEISKEVGIEFEFVNIGGGIGIPYKPEQEAVDLDVVAEGIMKGYGERFSGNGRTRPLKTFMESGRMITGPYGYLVSRVIHEKDTYRKYEGVDASMANLMRPGMYGAEDEGYHHITVLGKEGAPRTYTYDVTGGLCENNDRFAIRRLLPEIEIGDLIVIHDVGAHGHAMGFNYNGKLRSAEFLRRADSSFRLIRRAETEKDYFATSVD